jgi:hypothetical protein
MPGDIARDWVCGLRLRLAAVKGGRAWPPKAPERGSLEQRAAFWQTQRSDAELRAYSRDGVATLVRRVHDYVAAVATGDTERMRDEARGIRSEAERQLEELGG